LPFAIPNRKEKKNMQVNISQEMTQVVLQAVRYAINMRQEFTAGDGDNSVDLAQAKAFFEGLSEAQKPNTGLTEADREVLGDTI